MAEPSSPQSVDRHSILSADNVVVFVVAQLIAVPLCHAGADHFVKGEWWEVIFGFGVGIPLGAIGFTFPFWKHRVSGLARDWIWRVSQWLAPVAAIVVLSYVAGSGLYRWVAGPASVYDSRNALVGPLVGKGPDGSGVVIAKLQDKEHFLSVAQAGFVDNNPVFYFIVANCEGQAFAPYDRNVDLLPQARFDRKILWWLNAAQWGNYAVLSKKDASGCTNLPLNSSTLTAPVFPLTTLPFRPPFSVR
jgi:hypothetical protein